jgi:hypothetical protein
LQCLILKLFWKTFSFFIIFFLFRFSPRLSICVENIHPSLICLPNKLLLYNFFIKKSTPRINRGLFIMQKGELIGICFSSFPNYVFSKCFHFYFLFLCHLVKLVFTMVWTFPNETNYKIINCCLIKWKIQFLESYFYLTLIEAFPAPNIFNSAWHGNTRYKGLRVM